MPARPISFAQGLRLAREQADLILDHARQTSTGPIMAISRMPKLRVDYITGQRLHGASFWDTRARQWVIQINKDDHWKRQLFTVAYEFKSLLDYGFEDLLYHDVRLRSASRQADYAAQYFARYLLVPDTLLRAALSTGTTDIRALAEQFGVAEAVVHERLRELGLIGSRGTEAVRSREDRG
ncbi:ImmA/IrrE family metallo-endopeptidase [Nocardia sp. CC227C]|uniref:ImmA/IrrE family metallo-endopeptidase n=1 Tax=Nocardia sp. CC227C TaxID=3044562 RepID=UPI00278BB5C8|nr:ImmA/IrrE family metallo-endopeptidase [Nocardia sp. CC227C]